MKKVIILIAILNFGSSVGFSQNPVIDEKNGFREFKLNSPISNYESLELLGETEQGETIYEYSGDNYKSLYGKPIKSISLLSRLCKRVLWPGRI